MNAHSVVSAIAIAIKNDSNLCRRALVIRSLRKGNDLGKAAAKLARR